MKQYLIIILVLTSSCTSVKIPSRDTAMLAPFAGKEREHHEYKVGENTFIIGSLFDYDRQSFDSLKNGTIALELISDTRLKMTLKNKGQTKDILFKGKMNETEFHVRNKYILGGPLPPILWSLGSNSNSFCFDLNDKLVIYHEHGGMLMLVIMPAFGSSTGGRHVFEKVTD